MERLSVGTVIRDCYPPSGTYNNLWYISFDDGYLYHTRGIDNTHADCIPEEHVNLFYKPASKLAQVLYGY